MNRARLFYDKASKLEIRSGQFKIKFTVSIGCTEWLSDDKNLGDMIKRADQALYKAKNGGRNTVKFI